MDWRRQWFNCCTSKFNPGHDNVEAVLFGDIVASRNSNAGIPWVGLNASIPYTYTIIYIYTYTIIYIYIYIHRQCEGTAWTKNAWTFLLTFHPSKNGVWICEYLWGRTFPSCPTQAWFVGWSLAFILDWKISITQCNASGVECEDSGYWLGRSEIYKSSWTYTILYFIT